MVTTRTGLKNQAASFARKRGAITLLGFVAALALAIMFGTLIPPPNTAHAESSEPWLYMECVDYPVVEGDDFRLVVRKKYTGFDPAPYKKMRVFWYTEAGTADETDYERLYAEGQASNSYQSRTGKMGRDFHTLEDILPETDESYVVRFNNSVDHGSDDQCTITIRDDDGVGIYDLEIRSVPREFPLDDEGNETVEAYTAGDHILITARFNHPVTTRNPETGEQTGYAGLNLGIGGNRRTAHVMRGSGTDELIFGYVVQPDDFDLDGISVETDWISTGLVYNADTEDFGIWPVDAGHGSFNALSHGLEDDPAHLVMQPDVDATVVDPPPDAPIDDEPSILDPDPPEWAERSVNIEPNLLDEVEGELTEEDQGRDWIAFEGVGGEDYIIELKGKMNIQESDAAQGVGFITPYDPDFLIDPSILEIVDADGEQVLGERDQGGFLGNFARAFFTPESDGTYYIAVGAGNELRSGLGLYTLSVRADDYPDDYNARPDVLLLPGESIIASIDSDVPPDDPGLKPWHWWGTDSTTHPVYGLESLDDLDVFSFQISEEGSYALFVDDGPEGVGVWHISDQIGNVIFHVEGVPQQSVIQYLDPGEYRVAVGSPYESSGNTGLYTLVLVHASE